MIGTLRLAVLYCAALLHVLPAAAADCDATAGTPLGGTGFDAGDRLAVLNLVNSYGHLADNSGPLRFDELFTADATVRLQVGDKVLVDGLEQFKAFSGKRHGNFQREGKQRRHVLSAPRFDHQDAASASGNAYLEYYETRQGESPVLMYVGTYRFRAVKSAGGWKIACWVARTD